MKTFIFSTKLSAKLSPKLGFQQLLVAFAFASVLALPSAFADRVTPEMRPWAQTVTAALLTGQIVYTPLDLATNIIPAAARIQIENIADEQAEIWADTILEGDYVADGAVTVDSVEAAHLDGVFLGYRVTYSAKAYETMDCDPNKDLSACRSGRIVETSFVAPRLDSWVRDVQHLVEFTADDAP